MAIGIGIPFKRSSAFDWTGYWSTRYPSDLILTVVSDTEIDLDWTNNGTVDYDLISIERSLNGTTWTEITTVLNNEIAYSDSGLSGDTLYYYRIRYKKGVNYSAYSNIESDITITEAILTSDALYYLSTSDTLYYIKTT